MRIAISILFFLIVIAGSAHAQEASEVAIQVLKNQPWITETLTCPAASMPAPATLIGAAKNKCKAGKRGVCLNRCAAGNASACYWLANELQADHANANAVDALFQRSCKLGIMSGCTNRGARVLAHGLKGVATQKCAAQTFAIACDASDPWACTMFASLLNRGEGVAKNDDLALAALEKSCKYGPDDEACSSAMELKASILKSRSSITRK